MKLLFTFFLSVFSLVASIAQTIPNAGFESWAPTSFGYSDPQDWFTSNMMTFGTALTAEPATSGHSGSSALSLKNPSDGFSAFALTIFPSNQRPVALKGFYRYLPNQADSASVMVALYKTDSLGNQNAVGGGEFKIGGTSTLAWSEFVYQIEYFSTEEPDTIAIMVQASGQSDPKEATVLMIDDLEFVNLVNGVADAGKPLNLELYPNPAFNFCHVQLPEELGRAHQFQVTDMLGRVVQSGKITPEMQSTNKLLIDSSNLKGGIYQVQVTSHTKTATARLVVSR